MENLLRAYTSPILRNFEVQELKTFLPDYITDFPKKLRAVEAPGTSWEKIVQILNKNMEEDEASNELIDAVLFEKLFFNQDHVHIYHLDSEIDANEFITRFEEEPQLNRHVNATIEAEEKFISMRQIGNTVLILYRYETIKLGNSGQRAIFYVPCLLDFDKSLLQIRLRKHYAAASSTKHGEILSKMKDFINSLDGDVSAQPYSESDVHSMVYNIFKEESEKAESVIKEHMADGLTEETINEKILDFLENDLEMSEPELYSDRVKSAFYQDLSLHLDPSTFYNGFISAFTFLDKNFIRSSTRNPKRDPIYNSKVYWNLKDLIHEYEEVSELTCFWKFNEKDFDALPEGETFEFVEVSLRERNGSIEIHYYNSPSKQRRLKEDYVHYRISKYIFKETLSE
ncbi:hypothetical protein EI200_19700 [Peribacillus simplex]|uniref:hypothetical protein n=1 Tax=Peribacillus simplex TaxID=1478 RepID=UPI000F63E668|nr:hypothetical protein [Peribacillus simplex]RRN68444.1 hypothetical protein EI200_19700 [Peribacillus simplex]